MSQSRISVHASNSLFFLHDDDKTMNQNSEYESMQDRAARASNEPLSYSLQHSRFGFLRAGFQLFHSNEKFFRSPRTCEFLVAV